MREEKAPPKKKQKVGAPAARMSWDTLLETQVYHTRVACPGCDLAVAVRLRSDYRETKDSKSYVGEPEKALWQCCNCDKVVDRRSSCRDRTKLFKRLFRDRTRGCCGSSATLSSISIKVEVSFSFFCCTS